jgi:hypothetical protein
VLKMQGQSNLVVADVTNAASPKTICSLTGNPPGGSFSPELVSQSLISWYSSQNGQSVIAVLDLSANSSFVVARWSGGALMDGLHAWSPDRGYLVYVTSDANAVNLHLLSQGGDQVVADYGAVPGRGVDPSQDDDYLSFSPDGAYFAFVQTFTGSGDRLQVRRTRDGGVAYTLPTGTMASWGSTGSHLYFRQPGSGVVLVWNSTGGVQQALSQHLSWIRPRADAGDDNLAFTVRDSSDKPHVWVYGHGGRSGGELSNIRSGPVWLNTTTFFYVEESQCTTACGLGPAWQPDGKTFTYDIGAQSETVSKIAAVDSSWPSPGQV